MAVGYNFFKTLLLMYGLFHAGSSQPFVPIGANFCANNFPGTDNLSCVDDQDMGVGPCFVVEMLCNGANECTRGEDEGNGNFFDNIECRPAGSPNLLTSVFDCGSNFEIDLNLVCNGINDCVDTGFDEILPICDNKCLLPYYGGCSRERMCQTSRLGVNCGDCFQGVSLPGQAACGTLEVGSASFVEGDAGTMPGQVCATLTYNPLSVPTGGFSTPATVTFASIGSGGAVQGSDFQPLTTSLTFTHPTSTTGSITLQECIMFNIVNDIFAENPESFTVTVILTEAGASSPVNSASGSVTITDDDTLPVRIIPPVGSETPTFIVGEGSGPVEVCVQAVATAILKRVVSVMLSTQDGTAVGTGTGVSADFCSEEIRITFEPGEEGIVKCNCIDINGDDINEGTEDFALILASFPEGGTSITNSPGSVFIIDDDVSGIIATSDVNIVENMAMLVVHMILLGQNAPGRQCLVTASTMDGTAVSTGPNPDFVAAVQSATLDADFQVVYVELEILDDGISEGTENFQVFLSTSTPGCAIQFGVSPIDISIIDDEIGSNDLDLTVGFQQQVYTMVEDAGDRMVCLSVLSGMLPPGVSVTVNLVTSTGNDPNLPPATPGPLPGGVADYNPIPNPSSVTFTAGNTTQCITVDIFPDTADEPDELFIVQAIPIFGSQISIPDDNSNVIIADDDLIVVEFNEPRYTVNEGGPAVMICINVVGGLVGSAALTVVIINVAGGTAFVPDDLSDINQTLLFPPGTTLGSPNAQQCFPFLTSPDQRVEDQEDIVIEASSVNAKFTQSGNQVGIYINDDDALPVRIIPPFGLGVPNFNIGEDGGSAEVCVQAVANVGVLERTVSVMLSTQDGTAVGTGTGLSADFCSEEFKITFGPGEEGSVVCNHIDINNDTICEGPEDFALILTSRPEGGTSITNSPGSVLVIDNDVAGITAVYDINIPEDIGVFRIHVILLGQKAPGRQCVVTASTMDGTAVSTGVNIDYVAAFQAVTLDAAFQVAHINLEIVDDGINEGTENFQVFLSTSSPGCVIQDGVSPIDISIIDDDVITATSSDSTPESETPAPTDSVSPSETESDETTSQVTINTGSESDSSLAIIIGAAAGGAIITLLLVFVSLAIIVAIYMYKRHQERDPNLAVMINPQMQEGTASYASIGSDSLQWRTYHNPAYRPRQLDEHQQDEHQQEIFPLEPLPTGQRQEPSRAESPLSSAYATIT